MKKQEQFELQKKLFNPIYDQFGRDIWWKSNNQFDIQSRSVCWYGFRFGQLYDRLKELEK